MVMIILKKKIINSAQNKTINTGIIITLIGWYLYAIVMRNCHSSMSKLIDSLASEKKNAFVKHNCEDRLLQVVLYKIDSGELVSVKSGLDPDSIGTLEFRSG